MNKRFALQLGLVLALAAPVAALAEGASTSPAAEPTIDDIYTAAHAGKLTQADTMIAQVLGAHPSSAKAHFVHAELLAKEGHLGQAKAEYTRANELAPGLPFAKPQAVAGLLEKIDAQSTPARTLDRPTKGFSSPAATATDSTGMGTPAKLGLIVLLLAAGVWMFRRLRAGGPPQPPQPMHSVPASGYAMPSYANGPQGYAPMPASGPAYGAAPASGLGGGLGSALVTGAAMGLGAVAVEEAVRHFSHRDTGTGDVSIPRNDPPAFANNLGPDTGADLGGNDFGIVDDSTWDSGGGGGVDDSNGW